MFILALQIKTSRQQDVITEIRAFKVPDWMPYEKCRQERQKMKGLWLRVTIIMNGLSNENHAFTFEDF
jgi:hypothetical protein